MNTSRPLRGVQAISLDIWGTLVVGKRDYALVRLAYLFDQLGITGYDEEAAYQAYRTANQHYTRLSEQHAREYGMLHRLSKMFNVLGINRKLPSEAEIHQLQRGLAVLRLRYPPQLIEDDLPMTLRALRAKGITLGLLSNTGIDGGISMRPVLRALGILPLMRVALFTDEDHRGRAKPHPGLFLDMAARLGTAPGAVLHIGDSEAADLPAADAGLRVRHYAPQGSPHPHIRALRELLLAA